MQGQGLGYFGSSGSSFGSSSQPQTLNPYQYQQGPQSGVGMGGQHHGMAMGQQMHQHQQAAMAEISSLQLLTSNLGRDHDGAASVNMSQFLQRMEAAQTSQSLLITSSLERQSTAIAVSFESAALKLGEAIGDKLCEAMKGFGGARSKKGGRGNKRTAHSPTTDSKHAASSVTAESESACESSDTRVAKRARGTVRETRSDKAAKIANMVSIVVTENGLKTPLKFPSLGETCKLLYRFCKFIISPVPVMNSIVKHYMLLYNRMEVADVQVATRFYFILSYSLFVWYM